MSMHIVFMVSKYSIYVLADFCEQIPLTKKVWIQVYWEQELTGSDRMLNKLISLIFTLLSDNNSYLRFIYSWLGDDISPRLWQIITSLPIELCRNGDKRILQGLHKNNWIGFHFFCFHKENALMNASQRISFEQVWKKQAR